MQGYGYDEAVQLGMRKSDINEAYEQSISITADDKKKADRRRRSLERRDAREADRQQAEEAASIEARYLAREMRKFKERQSINNNK